MVTDFNCFPYREFFCKCISVIICRNFISAINRIYNAKCNSGNRCTKAIRFHKTKLPIVCPLIVKNSSIIFCFTVNQSVFCYRQFVNMFVNPIPIRCFGFLVCPCPRDQSLQDNRTLHGGIDVRTCGGCLDDLLSIRVGKGKLTTVKKIPFLIHLFNDDFVRRIHEFRCNHAVIRT